MIGALLFVEGLPKSSHFPLKLLLLIPCAALVGGWAAALAGFSLGVAEPWLKKQLGGVGGAMTVIVCISAYFFGVLLPAFRIYKGELAMAGFVVFLGTTMYFWGLMFAMSRGA